MNISPIFVDICPIHRNKNIPVFPRAPLSPAETSNPQLAKSRLETADISQKILLVLVQIIICQSCGGLKIVDRIIRWFNQRPLSWGWAGVLCVYQTRHASHVRQCGPMFGECDNSIKQVISKLKVSAKLSLTDSLISKDCYFLYTTNEKKQV